MRLFVAIDLPEAFRAALGALRDEQLSARWTPPEQHHLTLRFIGDVDAEGAAAVQAALHEVRAERIRLHLGGLTVFPSKRKPRTLVLDVEAAAGLMALHRQIESVLHSVGFEPEGRPFHPHVTLARMKGAHPQQVLAYLRARQEPGLGPFTAEAFHLYESTLTPAGALHRVLATYPLT